LVDVTDTPTVDASYEIKNVQPPMAITDTHNESHQTESNEEPNICSPPKIPRMKFLIIVIPRMPIMNQFIWDNGLLLWMSSNLPFRFRVMYTTRDMLFFMMHLTSQKLLKGIKFFVFAVNGMENLTDQIVSCHQN
jgi:hypothetical protein